MDNPTHDFDQDLLFHFDFWGQWICKLPPPTVATSAELLSLWMPFWEGKPDPQSAHLCLPHPRKAGCVLRSESSGLALKSYVDKDSSLWALCIMASQVMEAWSTVPPQVQKRAVNIRQREQGLSVHSVRCTEMLHFNFPHEKWPLKSTLQLVTVYMAYLSDIFVSGSDPRSYIDKCVKNGYKSEECHLECEGQVHGCFGTDHGSDTGS